MSKADAAAATVEAAVAHFRETAYMYGHAFDADSLALIEQHFARQKFSGLSEVVTYYESSLDLDALVDATCGKHARKILADLRRLAATSRDTASAEIEEDIMQSVLDDNPRNLLVAGRAATMEFAYDLAGIPAPQARYDLDPSLVASRAERDRLAAQLAAAREQNQGQATTFIESPFPTRVAYKRYLQLPPAEQRNALAAATAAISDGTWRANAPKWSRRPDTIPDSLSIGWPGEPQQGFINACLQRLSDLKMAGEDILASPASEDDLNNYMRGIPAADVEVHVELIRHWQQEPAQASVYVHYLEGLAPLNRRERCVPGGSKLSSCLCWLNRTPPCAQGEVRCDPPDRARRRASTLAMESLHPSERAAGFFRTRRPYRRLRWAATPRLWPEAHTSGRH